MTIEQKFHIIGEPSINFDYAVEFSEAEIWPKLVSLDTLSDKMEILRGRKNPAMVFRGSIKRLSLKDYNTVIRFAEKFMKG